MIHLNLQKSASRRALALLLIAFLLLGLLAACQSSSSTEDNAAQGDMTNMDMGSGQNTSGMDMGEGADGHDEAERQFVPNNGAVVQITTPDDGASFKTSDSVLVTIETTNFTIGEDGNHWHVYLDGFPTMIMGGNTYVLQNLSAGQHDIEVYLSNGQHQDLEQGDQVTIAVEE